MIRKILLLFLFTVLPEMATAEETVAIDGIWYHLYISNQTETTAYVTQHNYTGDIVIPESVTYKNITYRVTEIERCAFKSCTGLTSVAIGNSVRYIGGQAFEGCSNLTTVTMGSGVTSIGYSAFYNCSSLANVTIGSGVTFIGYSAFVNCSSLSSITIPNSVKSIGEYAFGGCSGLTSVLIPNSVTSLGESAFCWCSNLTSVIIGNNVTSIAKNAFSNCSSLIFVDIPNSITSIDAAAFRDCSALTSIDIPNSVTFIGNCAFSGCSGLTSITIPNSVTSIDSYCFSGCSGLTSFTIPNSVTSIGEYAFENCSGITSLTIGNSVESIGKYAFYDCSSLINVTIPNSVKSIGKFAFTGCSSLTYMTIPNSVTSIDRYTFMGCTGLTSVIIGNSVTSIGVSAFYGCSSLFSVTCLATEVPETSNDAFSESPVMVLYVPNGCVERYAAVEPWKNFKEIVETSDCTFPDLPISNDYFAATCYLYRLGVLSGTDNNGKMEVENPLHRSHLAKIGFRGLYSIKERSVPETVPSDNFPTIYTDLTDKTTYYYQAARALMYLEYGDGVTPFDRNRTKFDPEGNISRIHTLKALMETFNIQPDLEGTDNPFPNDDDVVNLSGRDPRMMGYIRQAASLGIITTANPQFRPNDNCLRGEAFTMLFRIMKAVDAGTIEDPNPQDKDYFQPLNTTMKTVSLGASLQMGNFQHYTKTSFALNGVVPLAFAHSYNSYNTTLPSMFYGDRFNEDVDDSYQPLGDGWSHNYHSFIALVGNYEVGADDNDKRLIVHWGGGSIHIYKYDGSEFIPESMGIYDVLTVDGSDILIKSKSQMEYRFSTLKGSSAGVFYLNSIKDRNDNELTINYENGVNGGKRISSVSDGNRSLNFYYLDGTNLLSEVKDPLNRSIKFAYFDNKQTGKKQLLSFTDAENNTTTYEYADLTKAGTSKLLSRIQLPKGNYIKNEYDANCRLKKTESGVGNFPTTKTSVTVNANYGGSNISTQSQVDVKRGFKLLSYNYTFNENNVVTKLTGKKDLYVNTSYDNDTHPELPTAIESNNKEISDVIYDAKGNISSITVKGDGKLTTSMTYDDMNNLRSITDPKGNMTTYSYDAKGNLNGISAPEGVTGSITVNEKGLPTETTNSLGVKTQYKYNDYGNLIKTTLPALGLSSEADYDAASRLTSATDALGRTSSFVYNNNDFLTSETDAMEHTTGYAYDANDNLTTITNAKGGVTTMSYDNATDWLKSVTFAGSTKKYSYNDDGSLNTFTKPDGTTISYSYDDLGRLTSDGINDYSYDNKLRLSSVSGNGKTLSFSYDGFNRITGTSYDGHNNSYGYDKNGNCTSINGTTYEYDGLNRLTSVTFTGGTITYTYRKDSRLSKVEYPNGMVTTYGYDEVGRLTSKQTKLSNGTIIAGYSYKLDKVGNITEQTTQEPYDDMLLTGEDISYSYNDANRITKAGDVSFKFDANGNTTDRGSEQYVWDSKNRLTKAASTEITYNPLGLITSYADISFTVNPLGAGTVLSDSKSGAQYIYGNGLEARVIGGKASYYVTDVRGSVVAIVDNSGNITHKYQYDEFGKVTQKQEADYNPFQYVGKHGVMYLNDHLYYMRARHYDPTIGRFLSEDPIWSTNLYPYADNNPIMGIDPEGRLSYSVGKIKYKDGYWFNNDELINQDILFWKLQHQEYKEAVEEIEEVLNALKKYRLIYNEEEADNNTKWRKDGVYIQDIGTKKAVVEDTDIFNKFQKIIDTKTYNDYVLIKRNIMQSKSADEKAIELLKNNYRLYQMYGSGSPYVDMSLITFYKDL